MNLNITGQHIEITPAMDALIRKKMDRLHHKFSPLSHIHVILNLEDKLRHKMEIVLHFMGVEFQASAHTADMYKTLDAVLDKMEHQLLHHKNKGNQHHE